MKKVFGVLFLVAASASAQVYDTAAVCRAPSFWATHSGTEKGRRNLTQEILDAWAANNGPLSICGRAITNTEVGSGESAVEAMCVLPKGAGRLVLARELTAVALNCILSTSVGDGVSCTVAGDNPCTAIFGEQIADVFTACNTACANDEAVGGCIEYLDCWNNGGSYESGECLVTEDSCADLEMRGVCFDFTAADAMGSQRACMDARKNNVTIFGLLP